MSTKRTNIELDEELVAEAMELYGTRTMRETVDLAVRHLVGQRMTPAEALALEGTGWEGDVVVSRAPTRGTGPDGYPAVPGDRMASSIAPRGAPARDVGARDRRHP